MVMTQTVYQTSRAYRKICLQFDRCLGDRGDRFEVVAALSIEVQVFSGQESPVPGFRHSPGA